MSESHICVGGPLQGRSFTEPPAGYHRCSIERGFKQGQRYVWEYNGTDCLDELLAAAVRYGKVRHLARYPGRSDLLQDLAFAISNGSDLDGRLDNEPFECEKRYKELPR